jgi:hypothetical protein
MVARRIIDRIADGGPPLARLAAQIGRSFLEAPPSKIHVEMHLFIERLLGG